MFCVLVRYMSSSGFPRQLTQDTGQMPQTWRGSISNSRHGWTEWVFTLVYCSSFLLSHSLSLLPRWLLIGLFFFGFASYCKIPFFSLLAQSQCKTLPSLHRTLTSNGKAPLPDGPAYPTHTLYNIITITPSLLFLTIPTTLNITVLFILKMLLRFICLFNLERQIYR